MEANQVQEAVASEEIPEINPKEKIEQTPPNETEVIAGLNERFMDSVKDPGLQNICRAMVANGENLVDFGKTGVALVAAVCAYIGSFHTDDLNFIAHINSLASTMTGTAVNMASQFRDNRAAAAATASEATQEGAADE